MGAVRQDLRLAVRMLVKNPGFSLVAILVLTLGIGGNAAIFSLLNAIVFRPLPIAHPERLVGTYSRSQATPDSYRAFSYPNYVDLRQRSDSFSSLAAHNLAMVGVADGDATRRSFADVVSSNYFATLGVEIRRGRGFLPEEETPGGEVPVVVVSDLFWRRLGADPRLLGGSVKINGRSFTVVGIAPPGFTGTTALFSPEVWLPMGVYATVANDFQGASRSLSDRGNHCLMLFGRLRDGTTLERANSELELVAANLRTAYPKENAEQTLLAAPLSRVSMSTAPVRDTALATVSVLLLAMSGIVLLIACLNLANMLLARGTARRREFAIRLAIGGGRGQIVRQLLVEGLVLSVIGGVAGSVLAYAGNRLLLASLTRMLPIPIVFPLAPDARTLLALIGFCALGTLLFGLGPALQMARPGVVDGLKDGNEAPVARGRLRGRFAARNLLVVGQLTLSMILLTAAGLFVRGALAAAHPELGYGIERGIVVELDASLAGYDEAASRDLYRRVVERLGTLPGVEAASLAATVPFGMVSLGDRVAPAEAPRPATPDERDPAAHSAGLNVVGSDYFRALGVGLRRGRGFTLGEEESATAPPAAVLDETLAAQLWPGQDPLGRRVRLARRQGLEYEVVGIAPSMRAHLFGDDAGGAIYLPFGRDFQSNVHVHLRTTDLDAARRQELLGAVRRELRAIDERLPVLGLQTLESQLDTSVELWMLRTGGRMFAVFGGLALFLAAVGAYGVRSYAVGRRTREIGIRMALGAQPAQARWLILREGFGLTVSGLLLGLVLAFGVARLLSGLLYEVSAGDPVVFALAPLVLAAVTTLACYLPARRASRVDPNVALRES